MEFKGDEILLLKNAKVTRNLNQIGIEKSFHTTMIVEPDLPEAVALRKWHVKFLDDLRSSAETKGTANQNSCTPTV